MRSHILRATALLTVLASVLLARPALAQNFPDDGAYEPLPCRRHFMVDDRRDEPNAENERDLVGTVEDPAGFRAADDNFLYLRLRLDGDAIPGGNILGYAWGVEINTDGDRSDYEILILVEGIAGGSVLLYRNTSTSVPDEPTDPADSPAFATYSLTTHAESTLAGDSRFGDNDDYFLSFAVPWSDLEQLGLSRTSRVRVWAASSTEITHLNLDFACHDGGSGDPRLSDLDGDETVIHPDVDSDSDGATDAEEVEGGSDPNDSGSLPSEDQLAGGGGCSVSHPAAAGGGFGLACVCLAVMLARRRRR